MKKEYLGILKKGLSKIQVVQLFNEKHQPKPVIRILDRNYHAGRTTMKLYCDNCGHMFKHEEQAYVKEHIYIKLGADVTSQYGGAIAGRNYGIIENCYNTGTVTSAYGANMGIGGIAGWNDGTIRECYNTGTIDQTGAGADGAGGICGRIRKGAVVEDCYNTGTIHSYYDAAGIVGYYSDDDYGFTIKNCYNAGSVSFDTGFADEISSNLNDPAPEGDITNCYYLDDVETEDGGKTAAQFASGEVAYLLNAGRSEAVWGQTLGTQERPVLGGAAVYRGYAYCYSEDISYSNDASAVSETKPEHRFTVLKCDGENHWYACATEGCPEIYGTEAHKGGEATYFRGPLCEVCGTEYGSPKVNPLDSVSHINSGNVTADDKTQLEEAKAAVEQELADNGAAYSEDVRAALEKRLEEIAELIKMLEDAAVPGTGDASHTLLWLMLTLISGGTAWMISVRRKGNKA